MFFKVFQVVRKKLQKFFKVV